MLSSLVGQRFAWECAGCLVTLLERHLFELTQLCSLCLQTAKVLADAVIPNEYGIDDQQKLRIGSKICSALMGKLLADLANMRDESIQTAVSQVVWDVVSVQNCMAQ